MADLIIRDNVDKHRFETDLGDGMAIAEYNLLSHAIMFTHTEVPEAHEGQGIGTKLSTTFNNVSNKLLRVLCGMLREERPYLQAYRSANPTLFAS